ncbi:MAG: NAD(+)/NADH kinase [Chloroflexi bacterium]|nr:NAD(+)/NADH kinase [Chloroflexota bacterium]
MKYAIAVRPDYPRAAAAASAAAARMRARGDDVVEVQLDSPTLAADVAGAQVACVFGGDGTMLRAARAFAPLGLALLGVNMGRLGFLTTTPSEQLDAVIAEVSQGRYSCEDRSLVHARLRRDGREVVHVNALNDVVVARGQLVRSIHIEVRIDDAPFTVYWADGLVVATATGSTAYGFSVGGPIILPHSDAVMIVPIAPHLSFRNAVVLEGDQRIDLRILDEPARLSLDGQEEHDLHVGDVIDVRRSATVARFVRTAGMRPFLELLRTKILKEDGGL